MRTLLTAVLVLSGALAGCLADGKELLAPEDPRYATMCADTTVVYEDYVCRRSQLLVEIPNPLYRP